MTERPQPTDVPLSDDVIREVYATLRRAVVVGASPTSGKASNYVPAYLQEQGIEIVPVNPNASEVLGVPAVPSLAHVEGPVDAVVVFRPAAEALEITREAIALRAGAVWLQEGVVSAEAAAAARDAGLRFVMDRCIGMTHGALGLGPGPDPEAAACAAPAALDGSRRPAR